jgi:hypothetical protein
MMSWGDREIPQPEPGRNQSQKHGFLDTLRRQFRAAMKALTQRPNTGPRRRKRKSGTVEHIKVYARSLLGRLSQPPAFGGFQSPWDTFMWMHLWNYQDLPGMEGHEIGAHIDPQNGLFPHL